MYGKTTFSERIKVDMQPSEYSQVSVYVFFQFTLTNAVITILSVHITYAIYTPGPAGGSRPMAFQGKQMFF